MVHGQTVTILSVPRYGRTSPREVVEGSVEVRGLALRYWVYGPGEPGVPLVTIHGGPGGVGLHGTCRSVPPSFGSAFALSLHSSPPS